MPNSTDKKHHFYIRKLIIALLISIALSVGLYAVISPFAISQLSRVGAVEVPEISTIGVETVEGQTFVVATVGGARKQLTPEHGQYSQPAASLRYAVWIVEERGEQLVQLHDVAADKTITLTTGGISQQPVVNDRGDVAWLTWQDDKWFPIVYLGAERVPVSEAETVAQLSMDDNVLLFSQKTNDDQWEIFSYQLGDRQLVSLGIGRYGKEFLLTADGVFQAGELVAPRSALLFKTPIMENIYLPPVVEDPQALSEEEQLASSNEPEEVEEVVEQPEEVPADEVSADGEVPGGEQVPPTPDPTPEASTSADPQQDGLADEAQPKLSPSPSPQPSADPTSSPSASAVPTSID